MPERAYAASVERDQGIALALSGAMLAVVSGCSSAVAHRDDMEHPLSALGGAGEVSVHPPEDRLPGAVWSATFGLFLPCIANGDQPAEITEIRWTSEEGLKPESVETYVRTFDPQRSDPYTSMKGTPLEPLDEHFTGEVSVGAEGYVAEAPCREASPGNGPLDEIMISMAVGDRGGHIGGVEFDYETGDGKTYTLEIEWDFYACGTAAPDRFECP